MALGDLYFDVLLNDKTDKGIKAIKDKLSGLGSDVGNDIANDIQSKLRGLSVDIKANVQGINIPSLSNIDVKINALVDKGKITSDIEDAIKSAKAGIRVGASSKSTLAYETEAQAKLINAQARLKATQDALAISANKVKIAQLGLSATQERTAQSTNRAQTEATKLARQKLALENATQRATKAHREFNNSLVSGGSTLSQMTSMAQRFVGVFAGGTLLSSLIRIRGEFEMQLVSLRAMMQSTERANELYGQLQKLSVISPFQFGDLVKYAKQLSAYQIPMGELYDTTKRLADMSAGLGVGMDRLILAYGQVKSATVLRGTELRQFTEAGIPMVDKLANKFSELEGRVVTAGEVFDKISKKEVPFEMVKEVIEDMTDEGGMFFEMQEKQAKTLQGQISNLKDAYAIMMNEIGQANDGLLKGGVSALRWSLENYQALLNVLTSIAAAYGAYRLQLAYKTSIMGKDTMATMQNALAEKQLQATKLGQEALTRKLTAQEQYLIATRGKLTQTDYRLMIANKQLNASQIKSLYLTGKITKEQFNTLAARAGMIRSERLQIANMTKMQRVNERLKMSLAGVGRAFKALGATLMASWPMLVIGLITELIMHLSQLGDEQKRVTQELRDNAKQALIDIRDFYKSHKVTIDMVEAGTISKEEAKKMLDETMKEIQRLAPDNVTAIEADIMIEEDAVERLQKALRYLEGIEDYANRVQTSLGEAKIREYAVEDNLAEDVGDFGEAIDDVVASMQKYGKESLTLADILAHTGAYTDFTKNGIITSDFKENINAVRGDLAEAKKEVDLFIADNKKHYEGLEGEARRVAISGLSKILKEQFKDLGQAETDIALNVFDKQVGDFSNSISAIAAHMVTKHKDTLKKMNGDYTGANEERLRELAEQSRKEMGLIYLDAQNLANNISQLEAILNVKLRITPESEKEEKPSEFFRYLIAGVYSNQSNITEWQQESINTISSWVAGIESHSEIVKVLKEKKKEAVSSLNELNSYAAKSQAVNDEIFRLNSIISETDVILDDLDYGRREIYRSVRSNLPTGGVFGQNEKEVLSWFEDVTTYAGAANVLNQKSKELKEEIKAAKKAPFGIVSESLKNYEEQLKIVEDLKKKYKVTSPTKGKQKDPRVEAIKSEYETLKSLYEWYEKLSELVGHDKAIEDLKKVEGFKGIFADESKKSLLANILVKNGDIYLLKEYIKELRELNNEDARKQAEQLEKALTSAESDLLFNDATYQINELNEALDVSIEKFKKWEDVYSRTGNKEFASLIAYGDSSKMRENIIENNKKELESLTGESFEKLFGFSDAYLEDNKHRYTNYVRDLLKKTKGLIKAEEDDLSSRLVDAFVNGMTTEDKVKQVKDQLKRDVYNIYADNKMSEADKINSINVLTQDAIRKIGELESEALALLPIWDKIFNPTKGFKGLKYAINASKEIIENLKGTGTTGVFSSSYMEDGIIKNLILTTEEVENLRDAHKDLMRAMAEQRPLMSLIDLYKKYLEAERKGEKFEPDPEVIDAATMEMVNRISNALTEVSNILQNISEEASKTVAELANVFSSMAQTFASGDWVGGILSFGTFIASKLISAFDEVKKNMDRATKKITRSQNLYDQISMAISRSLGGYIGDAEALYNKLVSEQNQYLTELGQAPLDIKSGNSINAGLLEWQRNELETQRKNTAKLLAGAMSDKDADVGEVQEYKKQWNELDDKVRHFAEDTLKDLMGIDLKDWASQIGDSLIDAFASGEDAAEAFDKTVGDLMKNIVKNMASLYIFEPMMKDLQTYLFGEDGEGGVFGRDLEFSEADLQGMLPYLDKIKNEGVPAAEKLFNAIDEGLGGLISLSTSAGKSGLSGSIQNITEETANILASYLNAVRADVALIASANPRMTTIAEAQLTQLSIIAENTTRNVVAVEAINNLLTSVTTMTSSGRTLKV